MRVICKQTTSSGFDLKEVTTVLSNDFDYNFGGHGIELNKEYIVMGIAMYKDSNCLYYLVDTSGRPNWFPYLLFFVSDNTVPQNWFVRMNGKKKNSDIYLVQGFQELCNDEKFYDQLIDRNDEAMQTYFKRKIELEKSLEETIR